MFFHISRFIKNIIYPVYRLTKTVLGTTATEQYTYDDTGNRLTGPASFTNQNTISTGNRLDATPTAGFTYDDNGNIISKVEGGVTTIYTYDGENRLVTASNTNGMSASYKYDPFGRRIEKTVNGATIKYLYDGANIVLKYDGSDNITARYVHNLGIDDPLGIIVGNGVVYQSLLEMQPYYSFAYHKDTLGSIRAITDDSKNVVNTYTYDSFGNITQTGTLSQPYAYTGREYDSETGLYYYRARYYDPKIGRFIQKDPISFAGGINLYSYAQSNPINWIDPWGLFRFGITDLGPRNTGVYILFYSPLLYELRWMPAHVQGFFSNGENIGYYPDGIEFTQNIRNYLLSPFRYDDDVMRRAFVNVLATGNWGASRYSKKSHNCQDFSDALKKEYRRLGGQVTFDPFGDL